MAGDEGQRQYRLGNQGARIGSRFRLVADWSAARSFFVEPIPKW
jgi:hypothetical protein